MWFNRIDPDAQTRAEKAVAAANIQLDRDRSELDSFRETLSTTILANNDLKAEIIRLKIENAELLKTRRPAAP